MSTTSEAAGRAPCGGPAAARARRPAARGDLRIGVVRAEDEAGARDRAAVVLRARVGDGQIAHRPIGVAGAPASAIGCGLASESERIRSCATRSPVSWRGAVCCTRSTKTLRGVGSAPCGTHFPFPSILIDAAAPGAIGKNWWFLYIGCRYHYYHQFQQVPRRAAGRAVMAQRIRISDTPCVDPRHARRGGTRAAFRWRYAAPDGSSACARRIGRVSFRARGVGPASRTGGGRRRVFRRKKDIAIMARNFRNSQPGGRVSRSAPGPTGGSGRRTAPLRNAGAPGPGDARMRRP